MNVIAKTKRLSEDSRFLQNLNQAIGLRRLPEFNSN